MAFKAWSRGVSSLSLSTGRSPQGSGPLTFMVMRKREVFIQVCGSTITGACWVKRMGLAWAVFLLHRAKRGDGERVRDFFEGSPASAGPSPHLFLSKLGSGWLLQLKIQCHSWLGYLALTKREAFSRLRGRSHIAPKNAWKTLGALLSPFFQSARAVALRRRLLLLSNHQLRSPLQEWNFVTWPAVRLRHSEKLRCFYLDAARTHLEKTSASHRDRVASIMSAHTARLHLK